MTWVLFLLFALVLGALSLVVTGSELRARLRKSWQFYLCALVLVPLLSLGLYARLGSSADLRVVDAFQQMVSRSSQGEAPSEAERLAFIDMLRERAEATQSAEYWYAVAGQYMAEGRYRQAVEGFARAAELSPEDISIKARQAEALFLAEGNRLTEGVRDLISEVSEVEPENVTINGLLGIASFQVGQWNLAIGYWERALAGMPADSPDAALFRSSIERARAMLNQQEGQTDEPAVDSGVQVRVQVSLADDLQAEPETAVFVFARPQGAPMPIAVKRLSVADLPAEVVLADADAMVASMQLSDYDAVDLVARVSFSGSPTANPGDYEATAASVNPETTEAIELVIDQVLE